MASGTVQVSQGRNVLALLSGSNPRVIFAAALGKEPVQPQKLGVLSIESNPGGEVSFTIHAKTLWWKGVGWKFPPGQWDATIQNSESLVFYSYVPDLLLRWEYF